MSISPCSADHVRQQPKKPRALDRLGELALFLCRDGGNAARNNLAALRHEPLQELDVLVVDRRRIGAGEWTALAPAVLPPSQELSILRRQCADDRLQGRQALAAVRVGARQDCSEPHYRRLGKETARARPSDQARAVSWAAALRDPLSKERSTWK